MYVHNVEVTSGLNACRGERRDGREVEDSCSTRSVHDGSSNAVNRQQSRRPGFTLRLYDANGVARGGLKLGEAQRVTRPAVGARCKSSCYPENAH